MGSETRSINSSSFTRITRFYLSGCKRRRFTVGGVSKGDDQTETPVVAIKFTLVVHKLVCVLCISYNLGK